MRAGAGWDETRPLRLNLALPSTTNARPASALARTPTPGRGQAVAMDPVTRERDRPEDPAPPPRCGRATPTPIVEDPSTPVPFGATPNTPGAGRGPPRRARRGRRHRRRRSRRRYAEFSEMPRTLNTSRSLAVIRMRRGRRSGVQGAKDDVAVDSGSHGRSRVDRRDGGSGRGTRGGGEEQAAWSGARSIPAWRPSVGSGTGLAIGSPIARSGVCSGARVAPFDRAGRRTAPSGHR